MTREDRSDRLAHLAGYAAIAGVLASATWSGPTGMAIGYGFGILVSVMFLEEAARRTYRRLRPGVAWVWRRVAGRVRRTAGAE